MTVNAAVSTEDPSASASVQASIEAPASTETARRRQLMPVVALRGGLARFECEILYNILLCHIGKRNYRDASAVADKLLLCGPGLAALGPNAEALAWFLLGVCSLAVGDAQSDAAREAFLESYASDPAYVDDF